MKNDIESIWREQRARLQSLAAQEGLRPLEEPGDLSAALGFAEMLSLAPSEGRTSKLLTEDKEAALSFLEVIESMDDAFAEADNQPSSAGLQGPFHELADFVSDFLRDLEKLAPDKFA